jgi:hypothetical protein
MRKMKKLWFMFPVLLISFVTYYAFSYGQTPFTPDGQKWEPVPTGHLPGKDNGTVSENLGDNPLHFQGADCGICHTPGGPAEDFVFTESGTIYKDKAGRLPLAGAEVILKDALGNIISMTTNEAGNFFTYAPIAPDPALGGSPDTPRNWRYKAWIKHDGIVRKMVTLAYVGAMPTFIPRMSCNMHHNGRLGTRGALNSGKFTTLPSYPAINISFQQHILPILKNRCKGCHAPESTSPYTTYNGETFNYSGGLDLSAYDKEPGSYMGLADVVNTSYPEGSLLLNKPLTGSQHGGGNFWDISDREYQVIKQWISEGAWNN